MDTIKHALTRRRCRGSRGRAFAALVLAALVLVASCGTGTLCAAELLAGVGKVDITDREAGPVHDPLYVRALVVSSGQTRAAIVTVDAVAIGEIGRIGNDYLPTVRERLQRELDIRPEHVLVNASHCHGVVCRDVAERTVQAVAAACRQMVPVRIGVGSGSEDRIMENRRLILKDGSQADVRHAYALPPDEQLAAVGPVDPEIGVLRLDRTDGQTLAVVYNFACHPIQGVPDGGNTADISGFASHVIEQNLSDGAVALFLQGCAGDVNPICYKDVDHPRDAEPLGTRLGLSTLRAVRNIDCREDARLTVRTRVVSLPRADFRQRIAAMEAEQTRLLQALQGTSLNLRTFLALRAKYSLAPEFPAYYAHRYLHDRALGRDDLERLDAANRREMQRYTDNVYTMEALTRNQINLALLRKHQAENAAAAQPTIDVQVSAWRIGELVLVTFPGELSVQIGLNIKQQSAHQRTFVAAYTNGYIYYAPTTDQLQNPGAAQEDCDCLLAPGWQEVYEQAVRELLQEL
jgi:hypothetical protein